MSYWRRLSCLALAATVAALAACGEVAKTESERTSLADSASPGPATNAGRKTSATQAADDDDDDDAGSGDDGEPSKAGPATASAFADVNAVLKKSCAGGLCHGAKSPFGTYVDSESAVVAEGRKIVDRVSSTKTDQMPPKGQTQTLTASQRKVLLAYLKAKGFSPQAVAAATTAPAGATTTVPPVQQKACPSLTDAEKTAALAMSFTAVDMIGKTACGGGGCHEYINVTTTLSTGTTGNNANNFNPNAGRLLFVGDQSQYLDALYGPTLIANTKSLAMPIGRTMTAADRKAFIDWICARGAF